MSAVDELREDLAELASALRDHLLALRAGGFAGVAPSSVEAEPEAAPDPEAFLEQLMAPRPAPAPVPLPPAAAAWGELAAADRAARAPSHHDDDPGAGGLARIAAELDGCTRCGLCEGRRTVVFGVGDPDADLLIIGEGPGEQEDARGEPFVGPAGQMLDRMLSAVLGLRRDQVYIANVVKCRPPDNRNPTDVEVATCLPFLRRQVAAVQPRLIVLLGDVALQAMTGRAGIFRARGQETVVLGVPAIPMFHPTYLLRRPEDKRLAFEDLKRIRARYDALGGRRSPVSGAGG